MWALVLVLTFAQPAGAQGFNYRGFFEIQSALYPQTTPQDSDQAVVEGRFRFEPAVRPFSWLTFSGSLDARIDNVEQVERERRVDTRDRGALRPALSLRQGAATIRKGTFSLDLGKQFVRWGRADILNPTDRFAPRDFLEVTDDEVLAVTAARARYERGPVSFDAVWVPIFTPSRTPLLDRRWAPPVVVPGSLVERDPVFPERAQYGARWNLLGPGFDLALSYFDGFNHLPQFTAEPVPDEMFISLERTYVPLRSAGFDAAVPLRWFTFKVEAAALYSRDSPSDDVVLYVGQLERQTGELSLVGGYAGEIVTRRRAPLTFAPDRGLTRAFLGRAAYTIGATRDISVETAVRKNLEGVWLKAQYSEAIGAHWRVTIAGAAVEGDEGDFIGQYRRNSHLLLTLRFSY